MTEASEHDQELAARSRRLDLLTKQSGWEDVKAILSEFYEDALDTLRRSDAAPEQVMLARAKIQAVEDLYSRIDGSIGFGKEAMVRYARSRAVTV